MSGLSGRGVATSAAENQAAAARQLLAGRLHAVISTLQADNPLQPFGSVAPYCLDYAGAPVFLLSHLAQHTRNLLERPHAALTLVAEFRGDVQQASRLTGEGVMRPLDEDKAVAARYFRHYPQAEVYHAELNFRFFRFTPERWHFNSGFATARRFGNDRLLRANPFAPDEELGVIEHMNADHADLLPRYLAAAGLPAPAGAIPQLCGVDAEGMNLRYGDQIERIAFARPAETPAALRERLVEMARVR